jgi:general nucleoside transport system ATP-binding protein
MTIWPTSNARCDQHAALMTPSVMPQPVRIPAVSAIFLTGIDKRFGAVHANKSVDLTIAAASIHGIVGENGAGKSTLMSILYGFYEADSGEIAVAGKLVRIRSSREAISHGIGMVHQHFMLVDTLSVLENIILGAEGGAMLAGGLGRARSELARLSRDFGLEIDPDAIVADLPVGLQQRVEILKALYRGAQILILDEPTAVLTPDEADALFVLLGALKAQGKTVILITHKLREIMHITDHVSVMRRGAMVATLATAQTSPAELAELMVGRRVLLQIDKQPCNPGPPVLEATGLTVIDAAGVTRLRDIALTVRAGEIVGLAGVSGNGQSELLAVLAGMVQPARGVIRLDGDILNAQDRNPSVLRQRGLMHVPEDRQKTGLITAFEARENSILGYHDDPAICQGPLIDNARVHALAQAQMTKSEDRQFLGRQPAEACAGSRDRAQSQGVAGRAADARRRYRRDRVHPPPAHRLARCRRRHSACLGRAGRDHGAVRSYSGHLRRHDHWGASA